MPENRVLLGHTKPEKKKNSPPRIFFLPKHLFSLPLQPAPLQAPGTPVRTQLKKTYKGLCFITSQVLDAKNHDLKKAIRSVKCQYNPVLPNATILQREQPE